MTDLGRRAVACKAWRWMPGVRRLRWAPGFSDHLRSEGRVPDHGDDWDYEAWPVVPDLTDPATLGCVLALDRGLYGDPDLYVGRFSTLDGDRWCVMTIAVGGGPAFTATSEAEALVLALEAAPVSP